MEALLIIGLMILNFGISWWNARVAGMVWAESAAMGGFIRLVVWCAAIQSAIGFSSVFLIILALGAFGMGYLPMEALKVAIDLWYLLIIIPALGSGFVIMIHSWIVAWRERSLASMGTAAWNTFANAYNAYSAVEGIGSAFSNVTGFFEDTIDSGDDAKAKLMMFIIFLVVVALAGGIILTTVLIQKYAGTLPLPAEHRSRAVVRS